MKRILFRFSKSLLILIFLSLGILSACGERPQSTLRIGTNVWPGYEPLYLARELGYLPQDKIKLVEFSSTSQVMQSFRNNLIDAACMTLDESLLLLQSGEDIRIILVMDISNGADAVIAKPEIKQLSDIAGKRVGVEKSALGAYMLSRTLELAGLAWHQINVVPVNIDGHESYYKQDKIDIVVTFEPVKSRLIKKGAEVLLDSAKLNNEIVDIMVIRKSFYEENETSVDMLIDAWYRALDKINQDKLGTAAILGKRMKLNVDETLEAYQGLILPDRATNKMLLSGQPDSTLLNTAKRLADVMKQHRLLVRDVQPKILFEPIGNNR